jgi:aldose 1-epimerase
MRTYILKNKNKVEAHLLTYGATLSSLKIPLKNGKNIDVVLGFDSLENYKKSFDISGAPYYGATVGRFAGRIKDGKFSVNGEEYQLFLNNNGNSLHGGLSGFAQKKWQIVSQSVNENPSITFRYTSPSLEENYPGTLIVDVTYTLTERNEFIIAYSATSSEDTIINLTHHSYFNLDGQDGSVENQELFVNANQLVETDANNIPTGKLIDLEHHAFDFRKPKKCPTHIDNTFVVVDNDKVCATLSSKKNEIKMDVITSQPGVHIYVGGSCQAELSGKNNVKYHALSGICFETQNFPDAPNHDNFPSAILRKGEKYHHKTTYSFQNL